MSTSALSVVTDLKEKRGLIQTSLAAVIAQLAILLIGILVTLLLGAKPDNALGYFQIMGTNPGAGLLIDDFFLYY